MTRRPGASQDETTPLLPPRTDVDGEGRWSLARRRSSAFLSALSEPEDKAGDEYHNYRRNLSIYLIVALSLVYNIGIGIYNSFAVELIQTIACAEYYYPAFSNDSRFPTLPTAGDPSELCSVSWVDKRTSQMTTYVDTFGSITSCMASLILANVLFPRFSRRTLSIASVLATMAFAAGLALVPTHYSFDPNVASTSTVHPTTSMYLVISIFVAGGMVGAPQVALLLICQVMVLDVSREDEKTSGFARVSASMTLGMAFASILLRLVLPSLGLSFSILHHSGPCSPFWMVTANSAVALLLVILFLPETKPSAVALTSSRRSSFSSDDSLAALDESAERAPGGPATRASGNSSPQTSVLQVGKDLLGLFGYLLPYRPHPGAKRDFKLPLTLLAVIFGDNITLVWSNLVVFCSTHLHFGPKETTTLLGILGATKGLYSLIALPWVVTVVRSIVKRRMREELLAVAVEELTTEARIHKREESVIFTDRIIAMVALAFDVAGFIAMGIAASHLSASGIYGSVFFLMFAAGVIPAIQALCVDYFQAQNRPTDDPVAARDALVGFLNFLQTLMTTVGPLINNAIYRWSIDHALPALVFFWTSCLSLLAFVFIASLNFVS